LRDEVSRALAEMGQSFRRLDRDINVAGAHGQLQRLEKVAYGVGREFGSLLRTMRITGSLIGGGDQPMRALLYLFLLVLPSLLFGAATVAAYRNRRSPSPPS
jgi:hypothetical protein